MAGKKRTAKPVKRRFGEKIKFVSKIDLNSIRKEIVQAEFEIRALGSARTKRQEQQAQEARKRKQDLLKKFKKITLKKIQQERK